MGLLNLQNKGRKASNQEQQAYKTLVTQVISFLMNDDDAIDILEQTAKQKGPGPALAYVVSQAIGQVGQAAKNAGVDVANHTGQAALGEILTVIATIMQKSGLTEDVQATVEEAMQIIMSGGQQAQPMQGA